MKLELLIRTFPGREEYYKQALKSVKEDGIKPTIFKATTDDPLEGLLESIQKSKSEYFTWVNDDDILLPGLVNKCVNLLDSNSKVVGVSTLGDKIDEKGNLIVEGFNFGEYDPKLHCIHPTHVHELTVVRTNLLKLYIKEALKFRVFYNWYLTGMIKSHGDWVKIQESGYQWRIHPGNLHNRDLPRNIRIEYNYVQHLIQESILG